MKKNNELTREEILALDGTMPEGPRVPALDLDGTHIASVVVGIIAAITLIAILQFVLSFA